MNIYFVIVFNLELNWCLACKFGEIPCVLSAIIKDSCLTVFIVLLGYYQIFESIGNPDGTYYVQLRDPVRTGPTWALSGPFC